jgi:hypothetical protein
MFKYEALDHELSHSGLKDELSAATAIAEHYRHDRAVGTSQQQRKGKSSDASM